MRGDGFRAQMEDRDVSFPGSGRKKKPDPDAGGFIYLG